jgi:Domain of unknown function (DUF932)
MKTSISLQQLAGQVTSQREYRRDFLVPDRAIEMADAGESCWIDLPNGGLQEFGITDTSHSQLAEKLGIDGRYYRKMRNLQPDLLADNVNAWLARSTEKRFVRTLHGKMRAYLSSRYQPIDSADILEQAVFPVMQELGLDGSAVKSCYLDSLGERMYIKVVNRHLEGEISAGDIVQSGFIVSNSDTGNGSAMVRPFVERLVCTNGLIVDEMQSRQNHVSRRRESYELYSEATRRKEAELFINKIKDLIRAVNTQSILDEIVGKMQAAKAHPIKVEAVEITAKHFELSHEEGKGVLDHLIMGGELSLYGLMNAYTRYSQDIESYERATDFERLGNKVLSLPDSSRILAVV